MEDEHLNQLLTELEGTAAIRKLEDADAFLANERLKARLTEGQGPEEETLRATIARRIDTLSFTNQYFDGKVRSRNLTIEGRRATRGEIDPGTYTFPTEAAEFIRVTSGTVYITPPGSSEEVELKAHETPAKADVQDEGSLAAQFPQLLDCIDIPANSSFKIRVEGKTASYECLYDDRETA